MIVVDVQTNLQHISSHFYSVDQFVFVLTFVWENYEKFKDRIVFLAKERYSLELTSFLRRRLIT